jgi:GNAT superfamily N-acetyltransferase
VRLLALPDIPGACELSASAGWNQTPADWERMIALEPLGCFCIENDGRIVATTTLLTYGRDLAWVGMVLTHADYQRRGYARRLVTASLELAAVRGINCVKLDATDQGRPLYASLGFEDEQPIERWHRSPAPLETARDIASAPLPASTDREAFGVDRTRFLNTFPLPLVVGDSYAFHRPGSRAKYAGPCAARDARTAADLMAATIATDPDASWFWDILPANQDAVAIARNLGFERARRLMRMVRGQNVRGDESMVYAIAGFEAG